MTRKYDLILWGATSFVGQITAQYLADKYGINNNLKWAIAGRNRDKLNNLINNLALNDIDILVGDSNDYDFLMTMTESTAVILSTVGPYLKYGEKLIQACVHTGTDYCDLTGEAPFVRKMRDLYHEKAKESGSRIINCCGVDSIPSDLGVYYLNNQAQKKYGGGEYINKATCCITAFKGGFSGGTLASLLNMIDSTRNDKGISETQNNPYALCNYGYTDEHQPDVKQPSLNKIRKYQSSSQNKNWLAPFVMASINTKIVHATNSLLNYPYSKDFIYSEYLAVSSYLRAFLIKSSLGALLLSLNIKPTRWLLEKYFLPKPGEGPSKQQQDEGFFVYYIDGETINNKKITVKITGDKDPGYGCTAKMFAEAGVCMAFDRSKSDVPGGFWTPAAAMGNYLIDRLMKNSGMTFSLV